MKTIKLILAAGFGFLTSFSYSQTSDVMYKRNTRLLDSLFQLRTASTVDSLTYTRLDTLIANNSAPLDSVFIAQPLNYPIMNEVERTHYVDSIKLFVDSSFITPGSADTTPRILPDTVFVTKAMVDSIVSNSENVASLYQLYQDKMPNITYDIAAKYRTQLLENLPEYSWHNAINPEILKTEAESGEAISLVQKLSATAKIEGYSFVRSNDTIQYTAHFSKQYNSGSNIAWDVNCGRIIQQLDGDSSSTAIIIWDSLHSSKHTAFITVVNLNTGECGVARVTPPTGVLTDDGGNPIGGGIPINFCLGITSATTLGISPQAQVLGNGGNVGIHGEILASCENNSLISRKWYEKDVVANSGFSEIPNQTSDILNYTLTEPWAIYYREDVYSVGPRLANAVVRTATASARVWPVMVPGLITLPRRGAVTTTFGIKLRDYVYVGSYSAWGGYTPPGSQYSYTWEVSVNEGPWQTVDLATYENNDISTWNIRVRLKATVVLPSNATTYPNLSTVMPEAVYGYSDIAYIYPYYQTVDYENRTYVRENTILVKGVTTWIQADQLTRDEKIETTIYGDKFGRKEQSVVKGFVYEDQSSTWKDLVQPFAYEAGELEAKKYLPYIPQNASTGMYNTDALNEQHSYYMNLYNDAYAFEQTIFENSPLHGALRTTAPGAAWSGADKGVSQDYEEYVASSEVVRLWTINSTTHLPETQAVYPPNYLIKTVVKDEKDKQTISYTNLLGQTVLKKVQLADGASLSQSHAGWLCTYFVYDEFGRVRYTISPKAVEWLSTHNWSLTQDIADELCFAMDYDARGRVISKKTPGKGAENFVYDNRNRLVFTQDAVQAAKTPQEWLTSLYDGLDRVVASGIYKGSTRTELENNLAGATGLTSTINMPGSLAPQNLVVDIRNYSIGLYTAGTSITFDADFESSTNDVFETEIQLSAVQGAQTFTVYGNPISQADITNHTFEPLQYNFYDDYSFGQAQAFQTNVNFAYKEGNVEDYTSTKRVYGLPTGSKTLVLDNSVSSQVFLTSTTYYDEKGRAIQNLKENIKGGVDLSAQQYHFDGRVLSRYSRQAVPGTAYDNFPVLTKYIFDKSRRLRRIGKKMYNITTSFSTSSVLAGSQEDGGYKIIAEYTYNDLGKQVKKTIAPNWNGTNTPLETIDYDYNIRGWLTAMNKDYASTNNEQQFDHYFGFKLGYDNGDGIFAGAQAQYNGNICGILWRSQGANTWRRGEFEYDNINRVLKADYDEAEGSFGGAWSKAKNDYSTINISYDANGNLAGMTNMGMVAGMTSPVMVDKLTYQYKPVSTGSLLNGNKLKSVADAATSGNANGKLGDFKNNNTSGNDDYDYDGNGSLEKDLNKGITDGSSKGIVYNYLNKPELIKVAGKGTIRYVYDAVGTKLRKVVTDNNNGSTIITTTTYIDGFVYKEVAPATGTAQGMKLEYFAHEEGRVRPITSYGTANDDNADVGSFALPDGKQGVYDYYLTDHLGNVRTVITEEIKKQKSICTMEEVNAAYEEGIFGNLPVNTAANEVYASRDDKPQDWTSNTSAKVSKLQATGGMPKIGPNVLIKVMAGDKISGAAKYFYRNNLSTPDPHNGVTSLVLALTGALSGGGAGEVAHGNATQITGNIGNSTYPLDNIFTSSAQGGDLKPQAYINYVFLDELLRPIPGKMGFDRVTSAKDAIVQMNDVQATANGYVYVYLSNESGEPVYFDDFFVKHERSQMVQEDHYYAFGLGIAALSSKATDVLEDKQKFNQGSELNDDLGINFYETGNRNFDAQIGSFRQIDKLASRCLNWSPYQFGYNNPNHFSDPSGLITTDEIMDHWNSGGNWHWDSETGWESVSHSEAAHHVVASLLQSLFGGAGGAGGGNGGLPDGLIDNFVKSVEAKDYLGAIQLIFDAFPKAFNYDRGRWLISMQDPKTIENTGMNGAFVTRDLNFPNSFYDAETVVPGDFMDKIAETHSEFGLILFICSLYHEEIHVKTYQGLEGLPKIRGFENRENEREFLAFYREMFNSPVLTPEIQRSILKAFVRGNYWGTFNDSLHQFYQPLYDRILSLAASLHFNIH